MPNLAEYDCNICGCDESFSRRESEKSPRRRSQKLGLSRALLEKGNQFLPLSSCLIFLKWYDCFLRFRCKMTMQYEVSYYWLHLFWYTLNFPILRCRAALCIRFPRALALCKTEFHPGFELISTLLFPTKIHIAQWARFIYIYKYIYIHIYIYDKLT